MILDFAWLPPEINSARIFAGAGSGPLAAAATAWDGLAADLQASATSFQSVITQLSSGPWSGPASAAMAAAAVPYVGWLSGAAAQAMAAGAQARAAAVAFETALTATIHPAAVTANRVTLSSLIATNFLGQNTPAIAATEFQYVEMWAADVGAMFGYHSGATSVAAAITPFSMPTLSLAGLTSWISQAGTEITSALSGVGGQLSSLGSSGLSGIGAGLGSQVSAIGAELSSEASALGLTGVYSSIQSAVSAVPLSSLTSVAQIAMYPASMMMSPMMSLAQMGSQGANAAGLASAATSLGDAPKLVGAVPDMKGLGGLGGGGLGAGMAADLGNARLVGAMSVPPTWQGSQPARMVSSAMSGMGVGGFQNAAAVGQQAGGGMPMMPMPMGGGAGAGGGMPLGRGGASPHLTQNRPSVVPRTGI